MRRQRRSCPLLARQSGPRGACEQSSNSSRPFLSHSARRASELGGLAPHVGDHDGLGLAGDRCLRGGYGHRPVSGAVYENGCGGKLQQRRHRREEAVVTADDFIAGADPGAIVQGVQRGRARGGGQGPRHTDVPGESVLEVLDDTAAVYRPRAGPGPVPAGRLPGPGSAGARVRAPAESGDGPPAAEGQVTTRDPLMQVSSPTVPALVRRSPGQASRRIPRRQYRSSSSRHDVRAAGAASDASRLGRPGTPTLPAPLAAPQRGSAAAEPRSRPPFRRGVSQTRGKRARRSRRMESSLPLTALGPDWSQSSDLQPTLREPQGHLRLVFHLASGAGRPRQQDRLGDRVPPGTPRSVRGSDSRGQ